MTIKYKNSEYQTITQEDNLDNLEDFFDFVPKDKIKVLKKSLFTYRDEYKRAIQVKDSKINIKEIIYQMNIFYKNSILEIFKFKSLPFDNKHELYYLKRGVYVENGMSIIGAFATYLLDTDVDSLNLRKIVEFICDKSIIEPEKFFSEQEWKLCVGNGVLDLKSHILTKFEDIPRNEYHHIKLNWEYNPKQKCPKFIKYLKSIMSDDNIITLQEFIGFCLVKGYPRESFLILTGGGKNGKSTLLKILRKFFGESNVAGLSISAFSNVKEDSFIFSGLRNKLVSMAGDNGTTPLSGEGIKRLTGEDVIFVNRKFREPLNIVNKAKFITSYNEIPIILDQSDGFWRRFLFIDFKNKFHTSTEYELLKEKTIYDKIADNDFINDILNDNSEFEGMLNWALEGLDRIERQNGFTESGTTEQVKDIIKRRSNSFHAFFEDIVEVTNDLTKHVVKEHVHGAYHEYCSNNNLKPVSNQVINDTLDSKGIIHSSRKKIGDESKQICMAISLKEPYQKYNDDKLLLHESNLNLFSGG